MRIYAPNREYTGVSASVAFCNGIGDTDNPNLIRWFKEHGYTLEELEEDEVKEPESPSPEVSEEGESFHAQGATHSKETDNTEVISKKGKGAAKKAGD